MGFWFSSSNQQKNTEGGINASYYLLVFMLNWLPRPARSSNLHERIYQEKRNSNKGDL
jgi:hypothetical protein